MTARTKPRATAVAGGTGSGAGSVCCGCTAGLGCCCCTGRSKYTGAGSELDDAGCWRCGMGSRGTGCGRDGAGVFEPPNRADGEGWTGAPKIPQLSGDVDEAAISSASC